MVLFEPLVWELSPFSIFNRFDHFVDIKILVLVDDSKFLENAGSVSELSLHRCGFCLQFFGQSISKLKYIIGSTFMFLVHECHHHFLEHVVLWLLLSLSKNKLNWLRLRLAVRLMALAKLLEYFHHLHLFQIFGAFE